MKRIFVCALILLRWSFPAAQVLVAQNPITPPGYYIADPTARVWENGKLYIYGSADESCDYYCSYDYHVLETSDLNRWTVHPNVLSSKGDNDVIPYSDELLYAPDAAYADGKYYIYYCMPDRNASEGVASSVDPQGPFVDATNIDLKGYNQIDPSVFIDDDNQAYYLWGQFTLKMARLRPGMRELDLATVRDSVLTEGEHHFHEGAFMTKRNGIYYIVFADISRGDRPTCIGYATATSPFGPYTYRGVIIDNNYCNPNNWNNHGSIAEYRDRWYVFYHRSTHGCNKMRKACIEPITFLPDGTIPEVEMTSQGAGPPLDAFSVTEAEWACLLNGNIRVQRYDNAGEELGQINNGDRAAFKYIDFGSGASSITFRFKPGGSAGRIAVVIDKPWHRPAAVVETNQSESLEWQTITVETETIRGVHAVWLNFNGEDGRIGSLDWFKFNKSIIAGSQSPFTGSRPYARYWWFASLIREEDIRYNLNWLNEHGFGGVELAWVYPLNRFSQADTSYTPRQEWLSDDWKSMVDYTIRYADSIGMGCDLTFGTLWPFGDSHVTFDQASRRYGDPAWRQIISRSWEHPRTGFVIDHLTQSNYMPYFRRLMNAFPRPATRIPQSYFIDSWEVETERLWCENFDRDFTVRFGYDIRQYMDSIYEVRNSRHLYDYMSLISDKVLRFYKDFDSTLNSAGIFSRGQVSGAPCDLISGYALMDIPESEAMLFEPEYSAIPASAALLSGKKVVSSETFTCLYGWPRDHIREEQTADLKLVADALFANGVNQIIWHGKAHNPKDYDTVNFYATVHLGDNGRLEPEVRQFNRYLETVSGYMKKGHTFADIAVYLPTEDAWTAGVMPKEKQFIWAWGYYEMRYVKFPEELHAYNPAWINGEFLEKATLENGVLKVGDATFKALYIDAVSMSYQTLRRVADLADKGLTVILKRDPQEPGTLLHNDYRKIVGDLRKMGNVYSVIPSDLIPFLKGKRIPDHWCRREGDNLYIFFPNPLSHQLFFPLEYGQSLNKRTHSLSIKVCINNADVKLNLRFRPYQSLLYRIADGKAEQIDITFVPETPVQMSRPKDYRAPWLVE